jgi:hypothetical protein
LRKHFGTLLWLTRVVVTFSFQTEVQRQVGAVKKVLFLRQKFFYEKSVAFCSKKIYPINFLGEKEFWAKKM